VIKNNIHKYSVSAMCQGLKISRSTYYYSTKKKEEDLEHLDDIINKINKIFEMNLTENDRLLFDQVIEDYKNIEGLKDKAMVNSYEEFKDSFSKKDFLRGSLKRKSANEDIFNKILSESSFKSFIIEEIARKLYNEFVSG